MRKYSLLVIAVSVFVEQSIGFCPYTTFNGAIPGSNKDFVSVSGLVRRICGDPIRSKCNGVSFSPKFYSVAHTPPIGLPRFATTRYSSDDDDQEDLDFEDPAGVVGGGALRGEQDYYSMRDLQTMRVTRLKSMCEARCVMFSPVPQRS
jgi:hypothetical protein